MFYFKDCKSIEEAKRHYRELLMQYHPDHAGNEGENITKEIINQFQAFLKNFVSHSFHTYYEDKEWEPDEEKVYEFQDILQQVINLDCQIEIIGYWIYCFNSKPVKDQLKDIGFWFSGKHKAWIYSGTAKKGRASKKTLDDIRAEKGSRKINKEAKEEQKKPQYKMVI
jgi:hypothetical protein